VLRKPFDSIEALQAAHALARKWILSLQVKQRMESLEQTVHNRSAALERTNQELCEQIERRNAAEQELRKLTTHDSLTGVPNRVLLRERLQAALARVARQQGQLAFLLLDLDHFKDVNDTYGHLAGDQVLKEFSDRLRACVRLSDTVARMGGDEFGILLEDISEPEEAAIIAERVLLACASPFDVLGNAVHVPPSIGIAVYPNDCSDAETIVQSAEVAMYEAKESGRATYRYFTHDMLESSQEKLMIREQLLQAVELGQLRVYYQPLLDARTGKVSSMEALVRWEHPVLGLVPPMKFIPTAEKSSLIVPIGAWVLRTACHQLAQWRKLGARRVSMAVNVSARELQSKGFVETVKTVLRDAELEPSALELELTESTAMRDPDLSVRVLTELADHGVRLAIDDFGSGYSSLMRLRSMPISVLKIDRFFVRDIVSSARDRAIVSAVITMAHALGLLVVAEGVETTEQLAALRDLRCDFSDTTCDRYQGYLLSRPLPADTATKFLLEDLRHQSPQMDTRAVLGSAGTTCEPASDTS
jgi:diguanylate cyclase (GGDEF)-like protein